MSTDITIIQRMSESGTAKLAWTGLTPDLLEKARGRVKTVAWLMLAVTGVGALIDLLYFTFFVGVTDPIWLAGSVLGVVLSVALIVIGNSARVPHVTVLHLALAYEVALCFILAVLTPWLMYAEVGDVPYVTWVTPLIILFPLIVPSPPRMTLMTAIAAAATRPLGLVLLDWLIGLDIPTMRYVASTASPAFAVVLAYAGSRIVHGMTVDLAQARRMGSYQLETRLGAGGMGEVWRARHQLLARPAAIKLVRPETLGLGGEEERVTLTRFEREAQATASMRSPHTIDLYDFGISQSGAFYYVMELLNGLDLDALVSRFGPVSPARAVHLLLQICDSLGEAHENGLIHRDIKPANVYVCRYGRQVDFVKVLDFGLVKFHHERDEVDLKITGENAVGGTPAFIAPEQVMGADVDGRTDIYALGCVAYWMLTGRYVFKGKSALATMMMHVEKTPQPPSASGEQPIPSALDRAVLVCLEKDPTGRPQTVDQLVTMLQACDVDDGWTPEKAWQWWEHHLPAGSRSDG
jgi:serine/threonine-protein kinase